MSSDRNDLPRIDTDGSDRDHEPRRSRANEEYEAFRVDTGGSGRSPDHPPLKRPGNRKTKRRSRPGRGQSLPDLLGPALKLAAGLGGIGFLVKAGPTVLLAFLGLGLLRGAGCTLAPRSLAWGPVTPPAVTPAPLPDRGPRPEPRPEPPPALKNIVKTKADPAPVPVPEPPSPAKKEGRPVPVPEEREEPEPEVKPQAPDAPDDPEPNEQWDPSEPVDGDVEPVGRTDDKPVPSGPPPQPDRPKPPGRPGLGQGFLGRPSPFPFPLAGPQEKGRPELEAVVNTGPGNTKRFDERSDLFNDLEGKTFLGTSQVYNQPSQRIRLALESVRDDGTNITGILETIEGKHVSKGFTGTLQAGSFHLGMFQTNTRQSDQLVIHLDKTNNGPGFGMLGISPWTSENPSTIVLKISLDGKQLEGTTLAGEYFKLHPQTEGEQPEQPQETKPKPKQKPKPKKSPKPKPPKRSTRAGKAKPQASLPRSTTAPIYMLCVHTTNDDETTASPSPTATSADSDADTPRHQDDFDPAGDGTTWHVWAHNDQYVAGLTWEFTHQGKDGCHGTFTCFKRGRPISKGTYTSPSAESPHIDLTSNRQTQLGRFEIDKNQGILRLSVSIDQRPPSVGSVNGEFFELRSTPPDPAKAARNHGTPALWTDPDDPFDDAEEGATAWELSHQNGKRVEHQVWEFTHQDGPAIRGTVVWYKQGRQIAKGTYTVPTPPSNQIDFKFNGTTRRGVFERSSSRGERRLKIRLAAKNAPRPEYYYNGIGDSFELRPHDAWKATLPGDQAVQAETAGEATEPALETQQADYKREPFDDAREGPTTWKIGRDGSFTCEFTRLSSTHGTFFGLGRTTKDAPGTYTLDIEKGHIDLTVKAPPPDTTLQDLRDRLAFAREQLTFMELYKDDPDQLEFIRSTFDGEPEDDIRDLERQIKEQEIKDQTPPPTHLTFAGTFAVDSRMDPSTHEYAWEIHVRMATEPGQPRPTGNGGQPLVLRRPGSADPTIIDDPFDDRGQGPTTWEVWKRNGKDVKEFVVFTHRDDRPGSFVWSTHGRFIALGTYTADPAKGHLDFTLNDGRTLLGAFALDTKDNKQRIHLCLARKQGRRPNSADDRGETIQLRPPYQDDAYGLQPTPLDLIDNNLPNDPNDPLDHPSDGPTVWEVVCDNGRVHFFGELWEFTHSTRGPSTYVIRERYRLREVYDPLPRQGTYTIDTAKGHIDLHYATNIVGPYTELAVFSVDRKDPRTLYVCLTHDYPDTPRRPDKNAIGDTSKFRNLTLRAVTKTPRRAKKSDPPETPKTDRFLRNPGDEGPLVFSFPPPVKDREPTQKEASMRAIFGKGWQPSVKKRDSRDPFDDRKKGPTVWDHAGTDPIQFSHGEFQNLQPSKERIDEEGNVLKETLDMTDLSRAYSGTVVWGSRVGIYTVDTDARHIDLQFGSDGTVTETFRGVFVVVPKSPDDDERRIKVLFSTTKRPQKYQVNAIGYNYQLVARPK